jgi:ribosomal protein L37AE/L43A
MPVRPGWYDEHWKKIDKKTQERIRTTCPKCGSSETYYNKHFQVWRCANCENSFRVQGYSGDKPWWKRILGR